MPLTCSEDLESFRYQTYEERKVCARISVSVDESVERKSSRSVRRTGSAVATGNNIFSRDRKQRSPAQGSQQSYQDSSSLSQEFDHGAEASGKQQLVAEVRQSWGLQFYEQ